MAKVLLIIAPERFRDEELLVTKEELEKDKHEIFIARIVKGICPGSRGGFATATLTLTYPPPGAGGPSATLPPTQPAVSVAAQRALEYIANRDSRQSGGASWRGPAPALRRAGREWYGGRRGSEPTAGTSAILFPASCRITRH